ncbi:MAG: AmmeMemoRadiSam system radical SAM enzyme [Bacteriovoracaceae bacterium]|nr:AmmeMemoRadiSam system radical SAM enzyme [Bacteriovoracaceae bacterium]
MQCKLCPKECRIAPGESGDCRIRINVDGKLKAVTFGHPVAVHVDPVEKKPLFHFIPGSKILSIATAGCNLHCLNCQNWEISQANPEDIDAYRLPPEDLIASAIKTKSISIAYTYTEPSVYYEYTLQSSKLARKNNIKNVLVTAAYLNKKPLEKLLRVSDAANVDLKSMSDKFYRTVCKATLKPVLDNLITFKKMGVHTEVTNLVIPTLNDTETELRSLAKWIKQNMGASTPLHFSRFSPQFKMRNLPPTPSDTLMRARDIAMAEGLHYVYIGNIHTTDGETTFCPKCKKTVIKRVGYKVIKNLLDETGRHPDCDYKIEGIWGI